MSDFETERLVQLSKDRPYGHRFADWPYRREYEYLLGRWLRRTRPDPETTGAPTGGVEAS